MAAKAAAPPPAGGMPELAQYVQEYWEKGWTVVPNVLTGDEADHLGELLLDICEEEKQAFIEANGELRNDGMTDMGPDGTSTPRKTGDPFHKRAKFQELATDGRLRAVAASMLQKPALIFSDQAFCKGPRVGGEKPRHQDNYYFGMDDSDNVITCWTALDDIGLDNGCMRLIRGAYRNGLVDHVQKQKDDGLGDGEGHFDWDACDGTFDLGLEEAVPVPKGATLCWHGAALHGSPPNHSDRWRRAWAVHFVAEGTTKGGDPTSVLDSCARYGDGPRGEGADAAPVFTNSNALVAPGDTRPAKL